MNAIRDRIIAARRKITENDEASSGVENNSKYKNQIKFSINQNPTTSWSAEEDSIGFSNPTIPNDDGVSIYNTCYKTRAAVLIINNDFISTSEDPRPRSEIYMNNLQDLFKQMQIEVNIHQNKTKKEMADIICNFSRKELLNNVDICFVVIMSYGIGTGITIDTSWIEEQFNSYHCKHLQEKPKIFIYTTCTNRTRNNTLIEHTTLNDNISKIDIGSRFIHLICKVFMKHAHDHHIEQILIHRTL